MNDHLPKNDTLWVRLLEQADDPNNWEYPGGYIQYRYDEKEKRFRALARDIARHFSVTRVQSFPEVQDATFHGDIYVSPKNLQTELAIVIRISKFGNFAIIIAPEEVDSNAREVLTMLLERHGYIIVPNRILDLPYTGCNRGVTGFTSWGDRYFDYA